MNSARGIFEPQEGFAPLPPTSSPFAVADEAPPASPFAVVAEPSSPFAAMKDETPRLTPESGRPAKLPEKRDPAVVADTRSPFSAVPEPAPAFAAARSPFEAAPAAAPAATSPFGAAPAQPAASPFSFSPEPAPAQPAAIPSQASPAVAAAIAAAATPATSYAPPPAPAPAPAPAHSYAPPSHPVAPVADYESDSRSIRQLELRAIFGVDRELSSDEILQRARTLPGIRHVARVAAEENGVIEGLKRLIANLGFAGGQVKLYSGSVPIDFIREGNVLLAVQTDGGFAPGVRETLMIVARELGRL